MIARHLIAAVVAMSLLGSHAAAAFADPPARGAPSTSQRSDPPPPEFAIQGSGGVTVKVVGIADYRGDEEKVFIAARKGMRQTTYVADARVDGLRFEADLGQFGRLDVHFEPGPVKRIRTSCRGKAEPTRTGFFEGSLEFSGEEGFTSVSEPSLRVPPLYLDPDLCYSVDLYTGGSRGVKFNVLARWGTTSAVQNAPGGKVRVAAFAENEVDGISISRLAEVMAPDSAFDWQADLRRARLAPPAPFSGAATWVEPRGKRTHWKGDLTVDFLGFRRYPLMPGPAFAQFEHGYCHVFLPPKPPYPIGPCIQ